MRASERRSEARRDFRSQSPLRSLSLSCPPPRRSHGGSARFLLLQQRRRSTLCRSLRWFLLGRTATLKSLTDSAMASWIVPVTSCARLAQDLRERFLQGRHRQSHAWRVKGGGLGRRHVAPPRLRKSAAGSERARKGAGVGSERGSPSALAIPVTLMRRPMQWMADKTSTGCYKKL